MIAILYYLEQTRKEDKKNDSKTGIEEKHLFPFFADVLLSFRVFPRFQKIGSTATDFLNWSFIGCYNSLKIFTPIAPVLSSGPVLSTNSTYSVNRPLQKAKKIAFCF